MLNSQQTLASNGLIEFVQKKEHSFALLLGPAGSGKTFTVAHVINSLGLKKEALLVACPTHKAKRVLVNALKKHNIDVNATTVSALIGKAPSASDDPDEEGQAKWNQSGGGVLPPNALLVLDEISMIDFHDMKAIKRVVDASNAQAILTGDFSQLRPVKGKSIAEAVEKIPLRFTLSEVMRSESSSILLASKSVRTTGEIDPACNDGKGVTFYNDSSAFDKTFLETENGVAIAYTNRRVSEMNQMKRRHIYGERALKEAFIPDEEVVLTEAPLFIRAVGKFSGNYSNIKVADNNDQLIILNSSARRTMVAPFVGTEVAYHDVMLLNPETNLEFEAKGMTYDMYTLSFKPVLDEILAKLRDFSSQLERLDKALDRRAEQRGLAEVDKLLLTENEIRKFFKPVEAEWVLHLPHTNPKFMSMVYPTDLESPFKYRPVKNSWRSLKGLAWARDYFGFRGQFAVLLYGHASTAHKAQGSTYQHVFVDWPNLMTIRDADDRQAACYVAVSRASDSLHVRV